MSSSPISAGKPFSIEKTTQIAEQFFRDGYVYIPNVLTSKEVSTLRDRTDQLLDDPDLKESTNPNLADVRYVQLGKHQETSEDLPFILRNTIELDQMFRDMLLREPIFSLAEAIVGIGCKFCGQNVLRNKPGSVSYTHLRAHET